MLAQASLGLEDTPSSTKLMTKLIEHYKILFPEEV